MNSIPFALSRGPCRQARARTPCSWWNTPAPGADRPLPVHRYCVVCPHTYVSIPTYQDIHLDAASECSPTFSKRFGSGCRACIFFRDMRAISLRAGSRAGSRFSPASFYLFEFSANEFPSAPAPSLHVYTIGKREARGTQTAIPKVLVTTNT